jgi:cell division cycle 14
MPRRPQQIESFPAIQIVKDRLYFHSGAKPPSSNSKAFFFSVDEELQYDPFNNDFGPLNLAQVHKYVRELVRLLVDPNFKGVKLYHYTSQAYDKQANSIFLMGCFMMVVLGMKSERVCTIFKPYREYVVPYRDASYGDCYYPCTLEHCWQGIEFATQLGWYSFKDFDDREYEYYEKLDNGDLNWIIPDKFMAFMGPVDEEDYDRMGNTPDDYI